MHEDTRSTSTHLECPECGQAFDAAKVQTFCTHCDSPLLARYDLARARKRLSKDAVGQRSGRLWRWEEILPLQDRNHIVHIGEGDSPLLATPRLAERTGIPHLFVKDESGQPTGSFKARGLAMAISKALELGVTELVIPTAGNAGGALSAYAARVGVHAHVYMPKDAPLSNQIEVRVAGADLYLVDGLISDAGRLAAEAARVYGWFDVAALREPYRLEGIKTMGLEIAEQFQWDLPEVILYPTGGGTGLIGMWKAFIELQQMGWISDRTPKMVSIQSTGCAPIVKAFSAGEMRAQVWANAQTIASGLRVPFPFADRLTLRTIYESGGTAIAVTDQEIEDAQRTMALTEGIFAAPEGAAALAGARKLLVTRWIEPSDRVVLYNTGTSLK